MTPRMKGIIIIPPPGASNWAAKELMTYYKTRLNNDLNVLFGRIINSYFKCFEIAMKFRSIFLNDQYYDEGCLN